MFGRKKSGRPGEIDVSEYDFLDRSKEFARFWIEEDGPGTYIIQPRNIGPDLFTFGMAMVDAIRHAARAYSQVVNVTEEQALERIFEGFDAERGHNTTGLNTVQNIGDDE